MIEGGWLALGAIKLIELGSDEIFAMLLDQAGEGPCVKLAPRHAKAPRKLLGGLEDAIGDGHRSFHARSMTPVIPASSGSLRGVREPAKRARDGQLDALVRTQAASV